MLLAERNMTKCRMPAIYTRGSIWLNLNTLVDILICASEVMIKKQQTLNHQAQAVANSLYTFFMSWEFAT